MGNLYVNEKDAILLKVLLENCDDTEDDELDKDIGKLIDRLDKIIYKTK